MRAAPAAEPGAFITDGVPRLHAPRDPDSGSDRFHFKPEEIILKIVQVLKFIAEHVGPAASDPSLTHLEGGE